MMFIMFAMRLELDLRRRTSLIEPMSDSLLRRDPRVAVSENVSQSVSIFAYSSMAAIDDWYSLESPGAGSPTLAASTDAMKSLWERPGKGMGEVAPSYSQVGS